MRNSVVREIQRGVLHSRRNLGGLIRNPDLSFYEISAILIIKGGEIRDMKTDIPLSAVHELLCSLGVTANYAGFFHLSFAVYLALQKPERLLFVTKRLYPEVAKHHSTSWHCVERNIRTASKRA